MGSWGGDEMPRVVLVGVGPGNPELLTLRGKEAIERARVIMGREDLLSLFPHKVGIPLRGDENTMRVLIGQALEDFAEVTVLLSGDPMLFSLAKHLPASWSLEIVPGVSSFQYFLARLGIPWDHCAIVNCHATQELSRFVFALEQGDGVVVFAGRRLQALRILEIIGALREDAEVFAGKDLSLPGEWIGRGTPESLRKTLPEEDGLFLLFVPPGKRRGIRFLEDHELARGTVPLTKKETRMLLLGILELAPEMTVLEVGAGAGGMTVEMARRIPGGKVVAVEKDPKALGYLRENLRRFFVTNVEIHEGVAPFAIPERSYERVFIGGSGGNLREILKKSYALLEVGGRIVCSAVTLKTLEEATATLGTLCGGDVGVLSQSITRFVGKSRQGQSLNTVFIVWGRKP
jgi:precorrin-6Y C5,15-methyltransferase (decarboxylating)